MTEQSLPEKIARTLRRDILRGRLAPGAQIKERDSAAELGVSRTPMREAIRILAREGLVILRPSRSPLVADPSLKEVTDAIAVLTALEVLSGKLACLHADARDIAAIRGIHERMTEIQDKTDLLDLFDLDMSFHLAIARASHNESLAATHGSYLQRLWRARYLSTGKRRNRDRVLHQHGGIVAGLEARDADRVSADIEAHLEDLAINIAEYFETRETEGSEAPPPEAVAAQIRKEQS